MHLPRFFLVLWLCALPLLGRAAVPWQIQTHESNGLPYASAGGQPGLSTEWAFWGANWRWAGARAGTAPGPDAAQRLTGEVADLGLQWSGQAQRQGERRLTYTLDMAARSAHTGVVGGGMVFKFNLPAFSPRMGQPVLLPGNTGWRWGREGGAQITLRFSPALPRVFFEPGNPAEIRAYFYDGRIAPGTQQTTMELTWSGDAAWLAPLAERLGGPPAEHWPRDVIDTRSAPPGLLGTSLAAAPRFAPLRGTAAARTRYWGTNITAYALFNTPRDTVRQQARRLAQLGYNLVRLHHHDSTWVSPNIFGAQNTLAQTGTLDAQALDKLDRWIKALQDEGIAIWLDLHVGRQFKPGDGITDYDEAAKGRSGAEPKGFAYVNPSMQQAMERFNAQYLEHRNAYTGLTYKDDPAIVALLITNENDITHHFGNALLPDKGVPQHNRRYMQAAETFARQHGLPPDKTWRSWEPGPSKLFLNDLEQRFDAAQIAALRQLGAPQALATTNTWGDNPLFSLPALTSGDLIDVHSYGGPGQLEKNPLQAAHLGHWLAAAQVVGLPLSVSEWNAEPFPAYDRHTLPLLIAAMASHQGWSALMHYAYTQEAAREGGSPSNWHAYNDPALTPVLSAAALMYRRGDVRPARTTYVYDPGAAAFFGQATSAGNAPALRVAAEKGRLLIAMPATAQLPWLERRAPPAGATVITDPQQALLPADAQQVTSDTGELTRDWVQGSYTITTARTQAAMGWIGGRRIALPAARLQLQTRHATVAVQSLSEEALGASSDVLVSIGTRALPERGKTPFRVEPLAGRLEIQAPAGLRLYRNGSFNRWIELPATYVDGWYHIALDGQLPVQWLALRKPD